MRQQNSQLRIRTDFQEGTIGLFLGISHFYRPRAPKRTAKYIRLSPQSESYYSTSHGIPAELIIRVLVDVLVDALSSRSREI